MALRAPFADLLDADPDDPALAALRRNELIGRPLGDRAFQDAISRRLGRATIRPTRRAASAHADNGRIARRGRNANACETILDLLDPFRRRRSRPRQARARRALPWLAAVARLA